MFIGRDDQSTYYQDHHYAIIATVDIMIKNEIEVGSMFVTGRQSVEVSFLSVVYFSTSERDGSDWLVSKLCSGKVYYHFISNITVFRLV